MIPFLPAIGWPQIVAAAVFLVGLVLVLLSRRMRKLERGGPAELRLFVIGSGMCLVAAVAGWIAI